MVAFFPLGNIKLSQTSPELPPPEAASAVKDLANANPQQATPRSVTFHLLKVNI